MSGRDEIAKAATVVSVCTALSRVLGFIRDAVIAYFFGAGYYTDIFFVAFRIPNFFRRLVGEGAFSASLVPVLKEEHEEGGDERVRFLSTSALTLFALIFALLTIAGILFSGTLVNILAPGFSASAEKLSLATSLTRWIFPFLFFIGLLAVASGILNSFKHFMAPAISPVFFNISIIFSVLLLRSYFSIPVYALVVGVVFGGMLQFVLQVPYLGEKGISLIPRLNLRDPAIRKIFCLIGPYALGVAVYQINIFITLRFASKLSEGSISYLYYADRLVQLPFGVFGVALATATLPSLSENVAMYDWVSFRKSLSFSLKMVNFVTIPSAIGLVALGFPITSILFQRGEFTTDAVHSTVFALYFYSAGLVAFSSTRIVASAFYSLKDTVTPVFAAMASVMANLIFCLLLVKPLKYGGLALATSLASYMNLIILLFFLGKKVGGAGAEVRDIALSGLKVLTVSIPMGFVVYGIYYFAWGGGVLWNFSVLLLSLFSGVLFFSFLSYLFCGYETDFIIKTLSKRSHLFSSVLIRLNKG